MERQGVSFIAMNFILLFVTIGFIFVVFDLMGLSFIFELGILLALMFLIAFAMFFVYHDKRGSWAILGSLLILLLLDAFVILILKRKFGIAEIITIFFAVLGIVVAFLNVFTEREIKPEAHVEAGGKYYYPYISKPEPVAGQKVQAVVQPQATAAVQHQPSVQSTFIPGKYVASRKANKFHIAKCDWAMRISKENQVWLNTKDEAQSRGFVADRCVI